MNTGTSVGIVFLLLMTGIAGIGLFLIRNMKTDVDLTLNKFENFTFTLQNSAHTLAASCVQPIPKGYATNWDNEGLIAVYQDEYRVVMTYQEYEYFRAHTKHNHEKKYVWYMFDKKYITKI